MGKALITVLSVLFAMAVLVGGGVWWVRALSAASFSLALLPIVFLSRRFTRAFPGEPWACHVAAAIAITFGVAALERVDVRRSGWASRRVCSSGSTWCSRFRSPGRAEVCRASWCC
jgi:hypothetical protein